MQLFDKLINPILNYGAEIWGFFQAIQIERVHLQFCKRLLGVKKSTQMISFNGELGRTPLLIRRGIIIIKYWFKILYSDENKYTNQIYKVMLNDITVLPTKRNWASQVKNALITTWILQCMVKPRSRRCRCVFYQSLSNG